jgi:hypothetical protein
MSGLVPRVVILSRAVQMRPKVTRFAILSSLKVCENNVSGALRSSNNTIFVKILTTVPEI